MKKTKIYIILLVLILVFAIIITYSLKPKRPFLSDMEFNNIKIFENNKLVNEILDNKNLEIFENMFETITLDKYKSITNNNKYIKEYKLLLEVNDGTERYWTIVKNKNNEYNFIINGYANV